MKSLFVFVLLAAMTASELTPAIAQPTNYPDRRITWVVPFPAGTSADVTARLISQRLSESLGQPIIVENKPGAATIIGIEYVARAAPDGYTVVQALNSLAAMPALYPKLPFSPARDLVPIIELASMPFIVIVDPSDSIDSVKQLIDYAKAHPGEVTYGSTGVGTIDHLSGALFETMAGVKMLHVPFKAGPAVQAEVMAGRLKLGFTGVATTRPHVVSGKLKPLAVTSPQRAKLLPDVPTLRESGLPQYDVVNSYGLYAPANTPREVVDKLNVEMNKVLRDEGTRKRLEELGLEPLGGSPEHLARKLATDTLKWKKIIDEGGIRVDN